MDDVLEENLERHALKEQRDMAAKYRNIGIGIMGLADALVKLGVVYGSKEAVTITRTIMQKIFIFAVDASVELAEERGSFPGYSPRVWDSEIINNAFDNEKVNEFRLTNKLRNCSLISIAPTGSIGTMFNVSTGCEPFFALSYNRRTVSLNKEETTYSVDIKAVDEYRKITGNMGELPPEFITSSQIPWKRRIDMQAALQKFTDTAISSTVNLPKETTVESIKSLYRYAYESGLKGVTIYRDGSRDPILSTSDNKEVSEELSVNTENAKALVEDSHSLKRGEIIKSGNNWIGIKRTLSKFR
jgi:ribonucleoside-diphosphate reductase alpha chain